MIEPFGSASARDLREDEMKIYFNANGRPMTAPQVRAVARLVDAGKLKHGEHVTPWKLRRLADKRRKA